MVQCVTKVRRKINKIIGNLQLDCKPALLTSDPVSTIKNKKTKKTKPSGNQSLINRLLECVYGNQNIMALNEN